MRRKLPALLSILLVLILSLSVSASARTPADYDATSPHALTADELYAQSAILIDAESGDVLFAKDAYTRMHPASTTKIMTLLLGIESGIALDQQIAIPQAAADIAKDSTMVPVFPGETMSFRDLLVGFFLNSGNDGANAVAVIVSGSVENFVEKMNQRAQEIGCRDTHFANAHGYTAEDHYTTAYDLALITRVAMQNEDFRSIAKLGRSTVHVNERGDIIVGTKRYMQIESSEYYYSGCVGVKSGTTSAAGNCFVGAAEKDGALLISVVLKAAEDGQRWVDTQRLFNYGWTCYETYTLDQMYEVASDRIASFIISNASEDDPFGGRLDLEIAQISSTDYLRMVEKDNPEALPAAVEDFISRTTVEITHDLTAPISMGEIIGEFSYYDNAAGNTVTAKLIAGRDVAERVVRAKLKDFFPFLKIFGNRLFLILLAVLALLIILIIALIISRHAARQRRRRRIYEQRRAQYMRNPQSNRPRSRRGGTNARHKSGATRRPR